MTPLLLAMALSLDGLGAGIAYGLKRIRVPPLALAVIAGTSVALFSLTLAGARAAVEVLTPGWSRILGALILVGIGLSNLWGEMRRGASLQDESRKEGKAGREAAALAPSAAPRDLWEWRLGSLAIVVRVLAEPTAADLDRSGRLSMEEAALLGLALALDAAAAGVGAGLSGLGRPWLPALVGGVTLLFIAAGLYLGRTWGGWGKATPALGRLPAYLLISLGLYRLFWWG